MSTIRTAYAALHSAVLLFALSALFAKWLNVSAITIVLGRCFFAVLALYLFIVVWQKKQLVIDGKSFIALLFTGALLAFHWLSFFYAIQVSTVALGLITFATFPVFVSVLEPIFFAEKFYFSSVIQAILTLLGIAFILPMETSQQAELIGAISGVISALSYALLIILNRKFVKKTPAHQVVFFQNGFAFLWLLPALLINPITLSATQLSMLILLGVVFTALAHSLFNFALITINAQTASLAVSLEPFYGMLAAYIFLDEKSGTMIFIGGVIIVLTNLWAVQSSGKNKSK